MKEMASPTRREGGINTRTMQSQQVPIGSDSGLCSHGAGQGKDYALPPDWLCLKKDLLGLGTGGGCMEYCQWSGECDGVQVWVLAYGALVGVGGWMWMHSHRSREMERGYWKARKGYSI